MKKTVGKVLFGGVSLFLIATGLLHLLAPEAGAAKHMIAANGPEGLSAIRGFIGAPLLAIGGSLMVAAITEDLANARAAAMFLLLLIVARVLSYVGDGPIDSIGLFLAIPSVCFVLMVTAHKLVESGDDHSGTVARAK